MPVKVLFLNSRSELGGANISLLEIVKHIDKNKISPYVLLPHPGPLEDDLLVAGVEEIIFCELNPLEKPRNFTDIIKFFVKLLPSTLQISKILRKHSIDIVYTNSSAIQTGALAAFINGIPRVWHIREIWISPVLLIKILNKFIYLLSTQIITITNAVRDHAFPQKNGKITTIYNGIDLHKFEQISVHKNLLNDLNIPQDAKIITIVARIVPLKGHRLLLNAFAKLVTEKDDVHLLIIGDIPRPMYQEYKDELQNYVIEKGLSQNIHFLGWQKNVPSWLKLSDILVLPSILPEALGVVILEAWASGVPVIASNHGGPQEFITSKVNGLLFESNDVNALYNALNLIFEDAHLREKMIQNGLLTVQEKFNARENVKVIQRLLLDLV